MVVQKQRNNRTWSRRIDELMVEIARTVIESDKTALMIRSTLDHTSALPRLPDVVLRIPK
jgi:hypothetical protein